MKPVLVFLAIRKIEFNLMFENTAFFSIPILLLDFASSISVLRNR